MRWVPGLSLGITAGQLPGSWPWTTTQLLSAHLREDLGIILTLCSLSHAPEQAHSILTPYCLLLFSGANGILATGSPLQTSVGP